VSWPWLQRATPAARMEKRSVARMPALYRERPKPPAPVCPGLKSSASWRDLDFPVPGVLDRTLAPSYLAASALRPGGRQEVTPSGGKRIAVWSRETAGAIRGLWEDRARQNNICGGRARRVPARARVNRRSRARGKNQTRRSRRDIAASSGGTTQNAAKTVMTDRIAARGAGPRSVLGATNAAREGKGGGRRGCGEKTLQQKRIERERADRDAPCNRPLPERPHRQSLYPLRSQSHSAKRHWSE